MASKKSEFDVRIVDITDVKVHGNADTLMIANIEGVDVIYKKGQFKPGDKAVYVPIDSLVPTDRSEFAFLKKEGRTKHRIKASRLRGVFSMGLLVPVPSNMGDLPPQEALGIEKYDVEAARESGPQNRNGKRKKYTGPNLPVYGLDPYRKYHSVLPFGTEVVVTEKIHGCNARYVHDGSKLWVGSHKVMRGCSQGRLSKFFAKALTWLKRKFGFYVSDAVDYWWEVAEDYALEQRLSTMPGFVLYGEVYGKGCQDLTYNSPNGRSFVAFDVYDIKNKRYLDYEQFTEFIFKMNASSMSHRFVAQAPLLYTGIWDEKKEEHFKNLANTGMTSMCVPTKDGHAQVSPHMMEGVVIKPAVEMVDDHVGRVALKFVGESYLLRKDE